MSTILIVEPDHQGHRFAYVRYVLENARADDTAILLTSVGARARTEFQLNLGDIELDALERLSTRVPPTREVAVAVADISRSHSVSTVIVMDGDIALKRWWWHAARSFRSLETTPEVSFLLTRYPVPRLRHPRTVLHCVAKGALTLLGFTTRAITRAGALSGRHDMTRGLIISRIRDPATCGSHSRDRSRLRTIHGVDENRRLIGVFGRIASDKNVELVTQAALMVGEDVDVLLAGRMSPEIASWLLDQPPQVRNRIIVRDRFLEEDVLDELLALSDVVTAAQTYDRPSAVMGKALAAGVPVLSAGSKVRKRELNGIGGGLACDLSADAMASSLRSLINSPVSAAGERGVALPTPQEMTEFLLGITQRPMPLFHWMAR